ncbi:MAG TPA: oligopeptide/dipeptide ABC transporter ATP-binding protein [Streptosporangiaceae bacterium]|nr:oligopeptide/dipeptide ABC transporter ATP-binding protein [Streptosporangiaceae bacterium]
MADQTRRVTAAADDNGSVLLALRDVTKRFAVSHRLRSGSRWLTAVDGVTLTVAAGETFAVVGETGCGKSTLARLMVGLTPVTSGSVLVGGRDVTRHSRRALRPLRRDTQLIFQDSFSSLNPRHTVGSIISEPFRIHGLVPRAERRAHVERLMELVGLSAESYDRFPRDFSGGQRQRISIARAIAVRPKLLICDEPVSALDVSIQAQILNLLLDLRSERGLSYVFISHDLAVVRQIADRVAVMYLGRVVELAQASELFSAPRHPYTAALLSATPVPDPAAARSTRRVVLQGDPPSPANPPSGCSFHPRCPRAQERCAAERPELSGDGGGSLVACHFPLAPGELLRPKAEGNAPAAAGSDGGSSLPVSPASEGGS